MIPAWNGRRVQQARIYMTRYLPAMCAADEHAPTCPGVIDGEDPKAWVVGHIASRAQYPEKTWDVRNWRIEARVCSDKSGPPTAIAKAYAAGQRDATAQKSREEKLDEDLDNGENEEALFSCAPHIRADKPAPLSLSGTSRPRITSASKARPLAATREPLEIRSDLGWDADRVRAYPWLAEFADVPADAAPPLAMTYPTDDAVCSYGWAGCEHLPDEEVPVVPWAEAEHRMTLRWWQRLAIVRQHEHRADGSLTWGEVVESASRRSGKSHRMRAVATWRLAHAAVIGETQSVVHCGNDLAVCRDVQKKAWRWAVGKWGAKAVKEGNGKEIIEVPGDGSSWVVKAQGAAYGLDAGLAMADECWDVKPDTISEGLEPMLLERLWAQLHLTSTAHRRARSTMKTRIAQALAVDDGRTLLLWWGALPQDDPGDPATWRKASPHWSTDRERILASKYEKALAGEVDPEADDPDPMEGFRAQYLNVWPPLNVKLVRGEPVVDKASWGELVVTKPTATPVAAAIAGHFDSGISLALAWRLADGAALVSVQPFDDPAAAGLALVATGYAGEVLTDPGLVDDPGLRTIRTAKSTGRGTTAVLDLARLLAEAQITHDGGDHLTKQILAVRTVDGADGVRLASHGRLDAVKAAAWASGAARTKPQRRAGTRVLVAST